jgi:hypothetical protein
MVKSQELNEKTIDDYLRKIKHYPHLLGHLIGYIKLIELHSQWIKECWDEKGSHGLMAFRGSYKTTSVVVVGIIRYLLFNPNARILLVRKTHEEACKVIKAVSKAFDRPEIQLLFTLAHGFAPQKITDKTDELLFNFKQDVTIEPSLLAKGINDAVTGAHVDVIIGDDVIGLKDKTSRAEREKTKESIMELAGNIVDPGALSIWLGTKWDANDGWVAIEKFTVVKKYPESKYNTFISKKELAEKKKRITPFLWSINYELEVIADKDQLFRNPRYEQFDKEAWRTSRIIAHLDAAYGGGDTCALTIMSAPMYEVRAGVAKEHQHSAIGWVFAGNVQDWYDFIVRKYQEWHCSEILMEKNADKGFVARDLAGMGLQCGLYTEHMNKQIKISTYLYRDWCDILWDEEQTDPEYMNQILDWKPDGNGYDDAPDSAASLRRERFGNYNVALDDEALAFFHGG